MATYIDIANSYLCNVSTQCMYSPVNVMIL